VQLEECGEDLDVIATAGSEDLELKTHLIITGLGGYEELILWNPYFIKKRTGYDYEIKNMLKNWASKIANTIETKKKHT